MSKDRVEEVRGLGSNVLVDQSQKPDDLERDTKRDTKTIQSFMTTFVTCFCVSFYSAFITLLLAFGSYMLTCSSSSLWDI